MSTSRRPAMSVGKSDPERLLPICQTTGVAPNAVRPSRTFWCWMTECCWRDGAELQQLLEGTFNGILHARMAGLPVLNPALKVQALNFFRYHPHWVGLLITPWFMNLLLLPQSASEWLQHDAGSRLTCRFPVGDFEFVVARESGLGLYASCSLYSPMFEFDCQAVAVTTAQAAWQFLFGEEAVLASAMDEPVAVAISRRDLLRGRIGQRKSGSSNQKAC